MGNIQGNMGRSDENIKTTVNQHAKMTPLGGKTASKIDPPLRCNITAGYSAENRGVNSGNHRKNSNQVSRQR